MHSCHIHSDSYCQLSSFFPQRYLNRQHIHTKMKWIIESSKQMKLIIWLIEFVSLYIISRNNKTKPKKIETLSRIKLTHSLPAFVEDTIELKMEERGVSVPWWWRCNSFFYGNLRIELLDKSLRYNEVWTANRTTTPYWWMFVWKIKILSLSLSKIRDKGCHLHDHRHFRTLCLQFLLETNFGTFNTVIFQF